MLGYRVLSTGAGSARRLVVSAAAKINLALEILGKRADGYHEIATVMQTVDLSDRLVLEDAADVALHTTSPGIPSDATNLAVRAADVVRRAAGSGRGVRITLDKRIPVAAGLGGGSADAAAVVVGLNRLWRLRWPVARLEAIAAEIGMDVPFFVRGGTALATGRGEKLEPLAAGALAVVLVHPRFAVSTAQAYGWVTADAYGDGSRARAVADAVRSRRATRVAATLYNGLEAAVAARHPEIERMKAALMAAGALGAAMSGSGPTVFGVARSFEHACQIRRRLTRGRWECWAVRTLTGPAIRITTTGRR